MIYSVGSYICSNLYNNASLNPPAALTCVALGVITAAGLWALQKQREPAGVLQSQGLYDRHFSNIELWRVFIDFERQKGGADCFDVKEPGYRAGMERAFSYLRNTIGKKMDANEFCYIHDLCVDGVQNESGKRMKKGFHPLMQYGFKAEYCEETHQKLKLAGSEKELNEALQEALEEGIFSGYPDHQPDSERFLGHYDCGSMRSLSSRDENITKRRVDGLFQKYYSRIEQATNRKEKLAAIVDLCRSLEIYHVFQDGNQRTIVFVLLNKLLIENDMCPVILTNPVIFDGYCTRERLIENVEEGMDRFLGFQSSRKRPKMKFSPILK